MAAPTTFLCQHEAVASDLFETAASLAAMLAAPVTIEDPDGHVLAYSGGNQEIDHARIDTILDRRVPPDVRAALAAAGVFERLEAEDDVIVVEVPELGMRPRGVVALRVGNRLIGSIWAAFTETPTDAQCSALREAAEVVAEDLRRETLQTDQARRSRQDALVRALAGEEALPGRWRVAAFEAAGTDPARAEQLDRALQLHLRALAPEALSGIVDDRVYAVVDEEAGRRLLEDFQRRSSAQPVIGLGSGVPPEQLGESRQEADEVVDALVRRGRRGVVHTMAEAYVDALVTRAEPFLRAHAHAGPLHRLERYDEKHRSGLVEVVQAYLGSGDVAKAADQLHVHPNTVRNRLRRAREQCGVDLGDPDTRLALMMALRLDRDCWPNAQPEG